MGVTKHLNFDIETKAIGKICKALGHPTRIQIMTLLWKRNNRTCGEIVELIPLAQSTISKHLLELKKANLVIVTNEGKKTIYSIEVENIQMLKMYLTSYLSTIELSEQNKATVLTTKRKPRGRNSHFKQYNYQFPDKIIKQAM
ncbi:MULTISPECIES: helix-turn-helix transcriptional regulator [unclassified Flavobacterium]|jgi:DNA-binding transcriptional ArsR family regulator|uniref:ArsR/SmtB family transcription factor n=1 Tax=unclassified Flavobacterium TaxID=196869 RepID=UPI00068EE3DF|nr:MULTISPECIES: metalloregulator ArsR/SmtB family transcription factor [unclassified Flavobacterium]MEA9413681.1 metalloregulator ArsR/SmtB family transcription factor [Flavobacterium sp. PL02]OUL62477.1 transcriptional regulator [Flavobacterium sp. AJR]